MHDYIDYMSMHPNPEKTKNEMSEKKIKRIQFAKEEMNISKFKLKKEKGMFWIYWGAIRTPRKSSAIYNFNHIHIYSHNVQLELYWTQFFPFQEFCF